MRATETRGRAPQRGAEPGMTERVEALVSQRVLTADPAAFRAEQAAWGVAGFAGGL